MVSWIVVLRLGLLDTYYLEFSSLKIEIYQLCCVGFSLQCKVLITLRVKSYYG